MTPRRARLAAPLLAALLCAGAPRPATAASPLPSEARALPWDLLEANVGAWADSRCSPAGTPPARSSGSP